MQDLKVIELANVLAGPAVGMFFAEMGAKVIKVENSKTDGDMTRRWKLPSESEESKVSAYYSSVNWNKEVLFLDLSNETDKEKLLHEVEDADIVIANYKKGGAEKLGVDYQTLSSQNPTLIYGHISGYGEDSDKTAYDVILQAESGFMSMNGTPESGPVKMPVALIDVLAAHQLKEGLLTALYQREQDGKGAYVHVSLYETAIASLANQATNWLMAGHVAQRMGSQHPNIAPYGDLFTCKDGRQVVPAIGTERQFQALCELLGQPQLVQDKRFYSNKNRVSNRNELNKALSPLFEKIDSKFLIAQCEAHQIPIGQIRTIDEVFTPEVQEKMVLKEKREGMDTSRVKTTVFSIHRPN